ncbi:MAG: FAD:protein FMN transferase [Actinomycetota bacterium]
MTSHTFETMGTVVSLVLPDRAGSGQAVSAVTNRFRDFDERYSLYREDSELSRIARGELALTASSEVLRATYAAALDWRTATGGAFTPHRPDDTIDLNGIVKALAMQAAAQDILHAGFTDWCLNAGGDVLCSGREADGSPWQVGIVDPTNRASLLFAVSMDGARHAIATSGSAERGDHIWSATAIDPRFAQATVIADTIETADVLATAIIAGGSIALESILQRWRVDVLTVARDGEMTATPGFASLLASS